MNDKILCYLTADAHRAIDMMVGVGLDRDLALSVLEQIWDENDIYELPAREEATHER